MSDSELLDVSTKMVSRYFDYMGTVWRKVVVTDATDSRLEFPAAIWQFHDQARATHAGGAKLMFIGNGGSAGIASHMAVDYSKNANIRSVTFNDAVSLTCLSNDLGYDQVFAKQVELHARAGDLLIAISSSGKSPNILNAVAAARSRECGIITLSGFKDSNPLRGLGDLNFYVPETEYGFVEIAHLMICHAVLDLACGVGVPV